MWGSVLNRIAYDSLFYFILINALCRLDYGMEENARYEYQENVKMYGFFGKINILDGGFYGIF
jgi:hypothetical protein